MIALTYAAPDGLTGWLLTFDPADGTARLSTLLDVHEGEVMAGSSVELPSAVLVGLVRALEALR